MSKRILITGASGLLGRQCFSVFSNDPEWTTLGLAWSRAGDRFKKVNLTDPQQVAAVVREFKPTVILHLAAERRLDFVEKEEEKTRQINLNSTQQLCDLAKEVGAYVLFTSTHYVFDGTHAPYKPTDEPNPLNKYGRSKADGEKIVLNSDPRNIILRIPLLYGDVEKLDESSVTVMFPKVMDTSKMFVVNDHQLLYPTSCLDLAGAIKILVDNRVKNLDLVGLFHWSGEELLTKYDMAIAMADVFGVSKDHTQADKHPPSGIPRPYDCHLDSTRLDELGGTKRTPFKVGIRDALLKWRI